MQELLEYFVYNYRMQNPYIENLLLGLFNQVKDDPAVSQDVKNGVFKALQMARGFTEYKASTVASDLGMAKSRVKALMKQAVDEGKIKLVVEYALTFIEPVQLTLENTHPSTQNLNNSADDDDDDEEFFIG